MKKLGLLLLTGAISLSLAACGGTTEVAKSPAENVSEETETKQEEETVDVTTNSDVEEFTITATNWDFASDKELTVKKGTVVKLNLVNEEGFHTISNDDLGIDLSPDAPTEFTADTTGEFELLCSIMCGAMDVHNAMKITLTVVD
ncbi:cytochrome c oxidase subunit II [Anaerobacillus sp. CMMVII]|uniref:cytochrome C oxidase subunit II n=1 Tax=Anaerobacillus sp. CMMVII TaxID=2755588 RepID=UPI0021B705C0|nr:cytochrome C oxidase subunit II [Anaerobacillus sp. CMMVII]MCT8137000.1 cytochrome c oxidase subunit II [Anaerobacillus sp. CMMVII]